MKILRILLGVLAALIWVPALLLMFPAMILSDLAAGDRWNYSAGVFWDSVTERLFN